jgi:elongation factor Tu
MPIEDVFTITGRGTVVTGRIERGVLKVNETVDIIGIKTEKTTTTVTGIEMFRKLLDEGQAGENVGLLLEASSARTSSAARSSASRLDHAAHRVRGQRLHPVQGRGWPAHAVLQQLPSAVLLPDDGRHGVVHLPEGTEMVMPGDNTEMRVEMIQPIAMEEGLKFAIREGGRTVGAGRVTKILK